MLGGFLQLVPFCVGPAEAQCAYPGVGTWPLEHWTVGCWQGVLLLARVLNLLQCRWQWLLPKLCSKSA